MRGGRLIFYLALEDSLSGSASESTDEGSDTESSKRLATLLSRATVKSRSPSPLSTQRNLPLTPLAWFHSPPSTQIGVYRAIFSSPDVAAPYLDQLREMQDCKEVEGKKWALFLVAGGHFAGAVVRVHRDRSKDDDGGKTRKGKPKKAIPDTEVITHKTFHRYTSEFGPIEAFVSICQLNFQRERSRVGPNRSTTTQKVQPSVLARCFAAMGNKHSET